MNRHSFTTLFSGAVVLLPFEGRARLVGNQSIIELLLARRATWP